MYAREYDFSFFFLVPGTSVNASSTIVDANELVHEDTLHGTARKRPRRDGGEQTSSHLEALPETVTVNGYEYLDTQWCSLQNVQTQIEYARRELEKQAKKAESEQDSNTTTLVNCLHHLIYVMQERGAKIKYGIERALKDRPNLREKYRFELNRFSDILKKCGCAPLEFECEKTGGTAVSEASDEC